MVSALGLTTPTEDMRPLHVRLGDNPPADIWSIVFIVTDKPDNQAQSHHAATEPVCRLLLISDDEIVAVCVHHPGPGRDEIAYELFAMIVLRIDLGAGAEDRVGAEDKINTRCGPAPRSGPAVDPLIEVVADRAPGEGHVRQVDEKIVRQLTDPICEHAMG